MRALLAAIPGWAYPMVALLALSGWLLFSKMKLENEYTKFKADITQERLDAAIERDQKGQELDAARAQADKALAQGRAAVAAAGAAADQRLRAAAKSWAVTDVPSHPGATCVDAGAPIVSVVPDDDRRAFVEAGKAADADREKLLSCQQWVQDLKRIVNKQNGNDRTQ